MISQFLVKLGNSAERYFHLIVALVAITAAFSIIFSTIAAVSEFENRATKILYSRANNSSGRVAGVSMAVAQAISWQGYSWDSVLVSYGGGSSYGNWYIDGSTLKQDEVSSLHYKILATSMTPLDNLEVVSTVRLRSGSEFGLCGRLDERGNGYCFSLGGSNRDVFFANFRNNDQNPEVGVGTLTSGRDPDVDYVMKFRLVGSRLYGKYYRADTPEPAEWTVETTHTEFTRGRVGFYTYGSRPTISSLSITPITVPVPTLISPVAGAVLDNGRTDRQDSIVWDFDWSNVTGATAYSLYVIGENAVYPLINNQNIVQSSYHYDSPGSYIVENNRYNWSWKVRALVNGIWSDWSEVRKFSVEPADTDSSYISLTLVSPNGGEQWMIGDTKTITWQSTGSGVSKVVAIGLRKGNVTVGSLAPNGAPFNSNSFTVTLNQSWLVAGEDYKVVIYDTGNPAIRDESDSSFSVIAKAAGLPDLTIENISFDGNLLMTTYCNRGTGLALNVGGFPATFYIKMTVNGITYDGKSDNGDYLYGVPAPGTCKITDGYGLSRFGSIQAGIVATVSAQIDWQSTVVESDENNNTFQATIALGSTTSAPTITLLFPNGGEMLDIQKEYQVTWNGTGPFPAGSVGVYLSLEKPGDPPFKPGNSGVLVGAGGLAKEGGAFTWRAGTYVGSNTQGTATVSPGSGYRIVATLWSFTDSKILAQDASDSYFTLVDAGIPPLPSKSVQVLSPNGGEVWKGGESKTITWKPLSGVGSYNLALISPDGQRSWSITRSLPSYTASYNWTVGSINCGSASGVCAGLLPNESITQVGAGSYYLRIVTFGGPTNQVNYDDSDTLFTIEGVTYTLPNPQVVFRGTEQYNTPDGKQWVRYRLSVENWSAFPNEMFAAAPDLAPCGSNTNSSRTWVNIYDASNGNYIYGFCAFKSSSDLTLPWFAEEPGVQPPSAVYIELLDRRMNKAYRSNNVTVTTNNQPSITLLSPNGGETWIKGSEQTIEWSATSSIQNVTIYLFPIDPWPPRLGYTLYQNVPNSGSIKWVINTDSGGKAIAVGTYILRIVDPVTYNAYDSYAPKPGTSDDSDRPFSITTGTSPQLPDLIVSDVTLLNNTAEVGGSISYSYTRKNIGAEGPAGISTWDQQGYLSLDKNYDVSDIPIPLTYSVSQYHIVLNWTHTLSGTKAIPSTVPPGSYYLIFREDVDNPVNNYPGVVESNEDNNWGVSLSQIIVGTPTPMPAPLPVPVDTSITQIQTRATQLKENNLEVILTELKILRNMVKEQQAEIKYLQNLTKDLAIRSSQAEEAIKNFITYGVDENTKKLGEGERAAVMHSYKSAFDKLPETEEELTDAIKIANGRWPSEESAKAEVRAAAEFKKIYQRDPNLENPNDDAAVTIMAYGLRQRAENRNLKSEAKGILTFRQLYGRTPTSTEDWNIVQAITYSGARR